MIKKEIALVDKKEVLEDITLRKSTRKERKVVYTMLTSSGCDFILNRKTSGTDRSLVSIFSKNVFSIYDEITGEKETVKDAAVLKKFFMDKQDYDVVIKSGWLDYRKDGIRKSEIEKWFRVLNSKEPAVRYAFQKNVCDIEELWDATYYKSYRSIYQKSPAFFLECLQTFQKENYNGWDMLENIVNFYGIDIARYYIRQKGRTPIYISRMDSGYFQRAKEMYHLDGRRLIDYLFFDLYSQGHTTCPHVTYFDYLDLQKQYYGKIKEKYPKNLDTAHEIMARKVQEFAALQEDSPEFAEIMANMEDFSYSNSIDPFVIRMPVESKELVEEGDVLRHCVASYVKKVTGGDCLVVFLREKSEPDTPYLTVEILPDRTVSQVEGLNRRSILSEEEKRFLWKWSKQKKLKISEEILTEEEMIRMPCKPIFISSEKKKVS